MLQFSLVLDTHDRMSRRTLAGEERRFYKISLLIGETVRSEKAVLTTGWTPGASAS